MVQSQQALMNWIDQLLDEATEPLDVEFDGEEQTIHRTAIGGFFKVIMRLPSDYVLPGQQQDTIFVFSLEDLYLLGFWDESIGKWRFFKDARLQGYEEEHIGEWVRMGFEGGYSGNPFEEVDVGFMGLTRTHEVLSDFSQRLKKGELAQIVNGLRRIMFTISEAKRFRDWLERVLYIFSIGAETMVGRSFGDLFHNWGTTSRTVLEGPAKFKPIFEYRTYRDAFMAISVVRNRLKLKRRLVKDVKDMKAKDLLLQPMPFLPQYDYNDDEASIEEEEGVTTDEEERSMPTRRIVRMRSPERMRMPRLPPRRAQRQRNAKKCCLLLLLLVICVVFFVLVCSIM
jgi:hypothetical protein